MAFVMKTQTRDQSIAMGTDPNLIKQIATETSRDKQTNANVYHSAKGGKLSDACKVLPKESNSKVLRKQALDEAKGYDVGEAEPRKMGHSSAPSEVSSFATSRTLLGAIGLEDTISKTSINKIKLINKHLGLHNHVDTFEQLKRTKVPVLKAINLSRISHDEYTRLG